VRGNCSSWIVDLNGSWSWFTLLFLVLGSLTRFIYWKS